MKKCLWGLAVGLLVGMHAGAAEKTHRLGGGVNYWVFLDDLDVKEMKENGFSYLASYQFRPTLLGVQVDWEFLPDMFGKDAHAPAAYVLLGQAIYAAAGVGILNMDGEWADDPFLALQAGMDLEVLPALFLNIFSSYRFNSQMDLKEAVKAIDTDTVFLGAAVRIGF